MSDNTDPRNRNRLVGPAAASEAKRGWNSDFVRFNATHRSRILQRLRLTYPESTREERRSWGDTVPKLQQEVGEVVRLDTHFARCTAVLEYELPMESRRADAVLLLHGSIVVIELKGKQVPSDADIDQAHAYARDLRCYHRECHDRPVHAVLVPTRMRGHHGLDRNVHVCGPDALDTLVGNIDTPRIGPSISARHFLAADAYRPLPSLIRAARELFLHKRPPQLWQAAANTDAAVDHIARIVADASLTRTRRLVLLAGVPGAGKTLVGMRIVHDPGLDLLKRGDRGAPAVFLSGNGPLVEVLQYVLGQAGGAGRAFVRPIREYVRRYERRPGLMPSEHVVVFDEAQRAFDRAKVADTHNQSLAHARSEPEHFIEFAERIPEWSVIVGLVGSGQEIHVGEEGGLSLWADAIRRSSNPDHWTVHVPPNSADSFRGLTVHASTELTLDETLRSHRAVRLHAFIATLLHKKPPRAQALRALAEELRDNGHDLRITRNRAVAERYLRERYGNHPDARFGLMASSRDRDLVRFGVPNDYQSTKRVRHGPWYNDGESDAGGRSCRYLRDCVTEFGAQGLELDAVLLAWGTDFVLSGGRWVTDRARRYRSAGHATVHDPWQLRANAYRVLLTRGRDAHVVFVPPLAELDETWTYLCACGFRPLSGS